VRGDSEMMGPARLPCVRITHTPTGASALCYHRFVSNAKQNAMRILRSKLWCLEHGIEPIQEEVCSIELPGDQQYPHELVEHRSEIGDL
jgi:hypothetical protein